MSIQLRPKKFASRDQNEDRIRMERLKGTKIFSNQEVLFEIHSSYIMFQPSDGIIDKPAIIDVMVAASTEVYLVFFLSSKYLILNMNGFYDYKDIQELLLHGYKMAVDMKPFGYQTSVWVRHQEEKHEVDDHLYDVGLLKAHSWFLHDPLIFKLMKVTNDFDICNIFKLSINTLQKI
jgi:hypothetical protein